jgi:hypothetical protein
VVVVAFVKNVNIPRFSILSPSPFPTPLSCHSFPPLTCRDAIGLVLVVVTSFFTNMLHLSPLPSHPLTLSPSHPLTLSPLPSPLPLRSPFASLRYHTISQVVRKRLTQGVRRAKSTTNRVSKLCNLRNSSAMRIVWASVSARFCRLGSERISLRASERKSEKRGRGEGG